MTAATDFANKMTTATDFSIRALIDTEETKTEPTEDKTPASLHPSPTPERDTPSSSSHSVSQAVELEPASSDGGELLRHVACDLVERELWGLFDHEATEMIITKAGRRMFPVVGVHVEIPYFDPLFLCPDTRFQLLLDIIPVDNRRYRYFYAKSKWQEAGKGDIQPRAVQYVHPDGPFTVQQLATTPCKFEKLKLTNATEIKEDKRKDHIILNSMHKYQARVHVLHWPHERGWDKNIDRLVDYHYKSFVFPSTKFMAVTAYQNQRVTQLKIENNPFAKGFRDSTRIEGDHPSMASLYSGAAVAASMYPMTNPMSCWPYQSMLGRVPQLMQQEYANASAAALLKMSPEYASALLKMSPQVMLPQYAEYATLLKTAAQHHNLLQTQLLQQQLSGTAKESTQNGRAEHSDDEAGHSPGHSSPKPTEASERKRDHEEVDAAALEDAAGCNKPSSPREDEGNRTDSPQNELKRSSALSTSPHNRTASKSGTSEATSLCRLDHLKQSLSSAIDSQGSPHTKKRKTILQH